MKINVVGDVLTMPYTLAKYLRKKNVDVTLFMDSSLIDESYSPSWEDEDLNEIGLPDWIKTKDVKIFQCFLRNEKGREFLKRLANCDLIHALGESCIWASFTGKPYIFQSYGFDLDYMPFNKSSLKSRILAWLQRRGIKKACEVLISPYQFDCLKKLGVSNNKYSFHSWGIDTNKYKKIDSCLGKEIRDKFNVDFVFFHPARHEWGDPKKIDKGNDKLICAFSAFLNNTGRKAELVFIEKGNDVSKSKELINRLGLENNILWLKPMNKKSLIEYYSISDLVFDQFCAGSFGQIFLESMSIGVPTFIFLLEDYEKYYEEFPPAINVFSIDDLVSEMIKLTDDAEYRIAIGNKSRAWMVKYHDWNVVTDKYITLYKKILEMRKFSIKKQQKVV